SICSAVAQSDGPAISVGTLLARAVKNFGQPISDSGQAGQCEFPPLQASPVRVPFVIPLQKIEAHKVERP
ncbi:unnamed protein product, partial [Amoebophrya sp. A25]